MHTGKMKPPLKPASTVMEMATSFAKATATRILRKHRHETQTFSGHPQQSKHTRSAAQ